VVPRISSRFVSAVALYGPKAEPVLGMFVRVQALITGHLGDAFLPYSLAQIHATLIAFNGVRDPETGAIVNEYFFEHTGTGRAMDIDLAMRILTERFARPLPVRVGGYRPGDQVPFRSQGQHLYQRTFSVQASPGRPSPRQQGAFVLVGWPTSPGLPLNRLRRDLNAAGLLHRYHAREDDIDGDLHIVVGHHRGAPARVLDGAVAAVRDELAAHPVEFGIAIGDVKVVAADSHTMAPPLYAGGLPVDASTVVALTGCLPLLADRMCFSGAWAVSPSQRCARRHATSLPLRALCSPRPSPPRPAGRITCEIDASCDSDV
jgi:hypothetical protein